MMNRKYRMFVRSGRSVLKTVLQVLFILAVVVAAFASIYYSVWIQWSLIASSIVAVTDSCDMNHMPIENFLSARWFCD